jgi:hypothetical protein
MGDRTAALARGLGVKDWPEEIPRRHIACLQLAA